VRRWSAGGPGDDAYVFTRAKTPDGSKPWHPTDAGDLLPLHDQLLHGIGRVAQARCANDIGLFGRRAHRSSVERSSSESTNAGFGRPPSSAPRPLCPSRQ
jgi:hypothetical protein